MKTQIYSTKGENRGEIEVPEIFNSPLRDDLLKKAFRVVSLSNRRPYGSSPLAGTRRVGSTSGPGMGIARMSRVAGSSRAIEHASTKGGRSAHSPRSTKVLTLKINKKEKAMAWNTALAMTADPEAVKIRGHQFREDLSFPIVVEDGLDSIIKSKDAMEVLQSLGVWSDIERSKEKTKIRAGRGKMRNRRYRTPKSILIVTENPAQMRAFKGFPGIDIAYSGNISISKLAPGGVGGRLVIFTESAIKKIGVEQ
ncbi:MAG: 50S ribosomal protein L4 [Candidatus Thermoplasmatota archaeon]|jgi:large subunit ribosomal protein L4e|nr:50S ribosomal protein L4 [Candidatus Thermoplasmatota archaeon]